MSNSAPLPISIWPAWDYEYSSSKFVNTVASPGLPAYRDDEEWSKALASRYVGMKNNRIIGGLLLHTTRMVDDADCSADSLSNRLDATCSINFLRSTLSSNGATDELLDQIFDTDAERSYGIDPVFLRSSTLYDTSLLDQYDWYYNTSSSSEVGPNGVPLGFRWRNMKGYENGFPVLFENRMREEQASNVMQYLMDGNYLDYKTKGLTAEILSYNRDLHVLGYARGNFKWMLDGSINVAWEFLGLPALDYLKNSDNTLQAGLKVFGKELVALWILIGFFTIYTIWYLVDCIRYYGRAEARDPAGDDWSLKRGLSALPTDSKLIYDIILVTAMISGGIVWSLYMGKYAMEFEARYTYNVYDSVTGKANWLLPIREDAAAIQGAATIESLQSGLFTDTTAGIDNHLLDSLNISAPWSGGMAGRLVSSFSFQHRLGLIGDTLVRAMPLLFHMFLLFLVVLLMFSVAVYIMLGWRRVEVATYKDALQDTFLSLVDYSRMQDTTNGATRRKLSHHPDADDADAWDGPTTKEEARPKTLEELCKFMSDSILHGVNQHHGAMQQVKGVHVGDVFIDERMTQVLIRALEADTELHTSLGHTLHVPLGELVHGPAFAIQNNGRPIAEGIEADDGTGIEYPDPPNTVVLRKTDKDNWRVGSTVIPLENDEVATSCDIPVDVSYNSNVPLKKSSEIQSLGDGVMSAKYLQAVRFPGQTTVAWEGPLKRDELMRLTVPRTVTQVPFMQLPEQTLMQILGEGFPDPMAPHWEPKSDAPGLMNNVTLPSEYHDDLLRTRNQLFSMLFRAVVASARSQRLVAEWHVNSWDETRIAVEHNLLLVRRSGMSVSSQAAKSSASAPTERFPSLHTPTPSPRLVDLEAAIEVLEQDHHLSWHSSMDPTTTVIDPNLAGLWPDMVKLFDGEGLHPRRSMSSTLVDTENQNSHASPRSKLSSSTVHLLLSSDDEGLQSKPSSPRAGAMLGQFVSFAKDPLHTPHCGDGWDNASSVVPLENDKVTPSSTSQVEVFRDSNCSLDLSSYLENFRAGSTLEADPQAFSFPEASQGSKCSLDLSSVLESFRAGNTLEADPQAFSCPELPQSSKCSLKISSEIESFRAGSTLEADRQAVISTEVFQDSKCS
eukprot:gene22445-29559_t